MALQPGTKVLLIREDQTKPPMRLLSMMSGVGRVWVECGNYTVFLSEARKIYDKLEADRRKLNLDVDEMLVDGHNRVKIPRYLPGG